MNLKEKSLEKLRTLINEETEYRSGPQLVKFFNELGFKDSYGQGFPSRWVYTDEKLQTINGTAELDKCIKKLFDPQNFIGRVSELDAHINDFNQYLAFDKWQVIRNEAEITFRKTDKINLNDSKASTKEEDFLNKDFDGVSIEKIGLDGIITETLNLRIEEIKRCFSSSASLSVIFLSGSTLEGILLGMALKYPKEFNTSKSSPKDKEGKVKQFPEWSLSQFIDVAYEIGLIKEDVKKFSHALRDFRNYIHPYEQVSSGFNPDEHTAQICWQVMKAVLFQLTQNQPK